MRHDDESTTFDDDETAGLGALTFLHPSGTFVPTPATAIAVRTIGLHRRLLTGNGIDWGSGIGCLAIAASRIPTVHRVTGLELIPANVSVARINAEVNAAAASCSFIVADSFEPVDARERTTVKGLRGSLDFITANPPASAGDDGFGFRRLVMKGASEMLSDGGVVFLNISFQYGSERIGSLTRQPSPFRHEGVLESSDWTPFDLNRPDLLLNLKDYAAAEEQGSPRYEFQGKDAAGFITAVEALRRFTESGDSPRTKWQTHLFRLRR